MDINKLVENYFAPKNLLTKDKLWDLFDEVLKESASPEQLREAKEKRFSYTIPFPRLVPTEAWGDPSSMNRAEINRVFSVVRGGHSIKARIADLNKFLTPETAKRRKSPNVILNMMMIVEALQATLNDYNESSAGFVFEAFMAALTGGKQISGRVKGTLPIEDFEAFSEFSSDDPSKKGAPVSLKLLSPDTAIKGSFTNLVDYLFVRGQEKIAYLIVYKDTIRGRVENLLIFDFEISRNNLIDTILGSAKQGKALFGKIDPAAIKRAIANWSGKTTDLDEIAQLMIQMPGYTDSGFLYKYAKEGILDLPSAEEEAPLSAEEEEELAAREREKKAASPQMRGLRTMQGELEESFHRREE